MWPSLKPSQRAALLGTIAPQSTSTTVTTGWVDVSKAENLLAAIQTGVLGSSATVDAKLQQASDSSGTGAKDISNKSITQLVKASNDNNQALINCRADELDINNGFTYARLSVTVGTAASLVSAQLWGFDVHQGPADGANATSVVQVVN